MMAGSLPELTVDESSTSVDELEYLLGLLNAEHETNMAAFMEFMAADSWEPTQPLVSRYLPGSSSNPALQEFDFFPDSSLEPSVGDSHRISCSDLSEAEEEALDTIRNVLLDDDDSFSSSSVEFLWDSIDRVKIIKKQGTVESENDEPDRYSHRIETPITVAGEAEKSECDMSSPRVESPITEKWLQSQQSQEAVDEIEKTTPTVRKRGVRKLDEEYGVDADTLHQYSDRKLEDAARILGVSRSTLKRICRKHGIFRWPPLKLKKSKSTFEESSQANGGNDEDQGIQEPVSNLRKGAPSKTTALRDARKIMAKVSYEDDIVIKFEVSLSSTMLELEEKVALRLKLAVGSFSVKYKDEENDWIFLACDEDVRTCINASTASGNSTTIRMKVSKCI